MKKKFKLGDEVIIPSLNIKENDYSAYIGVIHPIKLFFIKTFIYVVWIRAYNIDFSVQLLEKYLEKKWKNE